MPRKMPPCAICGRPAASLLFDFRICERCHAAVTAPDDICFECGEPLEEGDIAAGQVFCKLCEPGGPEEEDPESPLESPERKLIDN